LFFDSKIRFRKKKVNKKEGKLGFTKILGETAFILFNKEKHISVMLLEIQLIKRQYRGKF
jgi:hypothetical protein